MIIQMIPLYEKGNILTEDMLESMKQYTLDYSMLIMDGYSDGIVRGFELNAAGGLLNVGRGIVRFQGQVYLLPKHMTVPYEPVRQEMVLKLILKGESRTKHFICKEALLQLDHNEEKKSTEIEICRFKLQEGATLRNNYQNFADYSTEFDTIQEIQADWAAYGEKSISPRILKAFASEAMETSLADPVDVMFCQQILCLKGETLNRQAVSFYIRKKLGEELTGTSNEALYQKLLKILNKLKNERKGAENAPARRQRFVIS